MSRHAAWTALALALLALSVITWWLVPDVSSPGGSDYMIRPPGVLEDHESAIGALAALVLVACSLVVLSPAGRTALGSRYLKAAVPLACLALFLGFAYRVITAAVGGANIGGGLVGMFGMAFVPAMLLVAFLQFRRH